MSARKAAADLCSDVLVDGTFEVGNPWPAWTVQTSTNWGTPLCDTSACGTGGLPPYAGTNWVWFIAGPVTETAALGQTVTLPPSASVMLRFMLYVAGASSIDALTVSLDTIPLATFTGNSPTSGYVSVVLAVPSSVPPGAHSLVFRHQAPPYVEGDSSSFGLDNVGLTVCMADVIFADGFQ